MNNLQDKNSPLSNLSKENPFRVPNHYFDDLSARLQARIDAEKVIVPDHQPNRFIKILKPALGLAASFALIFLLVYWPIKKFTPNQSAKNQTEESNLTDEEYMNAILKEMDEYSFYALFDDSPEESSLSEEEIANFIRANSSNYELYAETYSNK